MSETVSKIDMLKEILQCGYADLDFLEKEFDVFEVQPYEVNFKIKTFNEIIEQIYEKACEKAGIEDIYDNSIYEVSIFTNFLDSHLNINDEEMYCFEDIKNIVKKTN